MYRIRPAGHADEPFLWTMLYYAAHMSEDGEAAPDAAKRSPSLAKYVTEWGRSTDMGFIAVDEQQQQPVGAVWARLLIGDNKTNGYVDDETPELAIAVLPFYSGQGIGTHLLVAFLDAAQWVYPAVALNVRANNPAHRLYERLGFVVIDEIINRVGTRSYTMLIRFRAG